MKKLIFFAAILIVNVSKSYSQTLSAFGCFVGSSLCGNAIRPLLKNAPRAVRSGGISVVFKNKLWLFSGKHTDGKHNWGGDVWTLSAK
ncbi:hypothetical protein [Runella sp.]|uniref:hypothetical protein n=1 Tax=Runella sp. TaxID=1960881 RepID=UPI003D0F053A